MDARRQKIADLEQKISALIAKQGDYFKLKKADRKVADIEAIRKELNEYKAQVRPLYRAK